MNLELTDTMIKRNDEIDNATYNYLMTLLETDESEFAWDINIIEEITDVVKKALWDVWGLKVRHPSVVTNEDDTQYYSDYDFE